MVDQGTSVGSHDITLRIKYRDHLNQEHSQTIEIPIDIVDPVPETNQNENQGILGWILSILGMRK